MIPNNGWKEILESALNRMDKEYLEFIRCGDYLPGKDRVFNAFGNLEPNNVRYILFGQDPYPRKESAIGYAFIDGGVEKIFDHENGFSKEVNRAVSLRNFLKMALVAMGRLHGDTSKEAVKRVDKSDLINSMDELRENFEKNGILLLNRSLVYTSKDSLTYHARMWREFLAKLLYGLRDRDIELILLGSLAKEIEALTEGMGFRVFKAQHPFNCGFVTDRAVLDKFAPFELMKKR